MATQTVTAEYIEGIKEGRAILVKCDPADIGAQARLDNLNNTIKGFCAASPVGQMLRGERDFWANQVKRSAVQG